MPTARPKTRIRSTRTLKVTELEISAEERGMLSQLFNDPRYVALLNVMERGCIELETAHLNTPIGDTEGILAGHCMTKGVWLFFTYIQKQVSNAFHTNTADDERPVETATLDDVLQGVN